MSKINKPRSNSISMLLRNLEINVEINRYES